MLVFAFSAPNSAQTIENITPERFFAESAGPDRVILIEGNELARQSRISLLSSAESTIDIALHQIGNDQTSYLFYGFLIQAADRGVKVRLLIDGIFHSFHGSHRQTLRALISHPNIDIRLYEPFNLTRPWTWNNRFHSKLLIIDSKTSIIGGRNIGDRYFASDQTGQKYVADRDVVLFNTVPQSSAASVLPEIGKYFDTIWKHDCAALVSQKMSTRQMRQAQMKSTMLLTLAQEHMQTNEYQKIHSIDWSRYTFPANKITLVSNPVQAFTKEPRVLAELSEIMKSAEEKIVMQSPYVVPTRQMSRYFSLADIADKDVTILTNSIAASPNLAAIAGYANKKRSIISQVDALYEYQGSGSLHGKSYIIDNRISIIGSFNFDSRSAFLSTEAVVVIDSEPLARAIQHEIDQLSQNSLRVNNDGMYEKIEQLSPREASLPKKMIVSFLRVLLYFFDFML